jgi:hypothetical protein
MILKLKRVSIIEPGAFGVLMLDEVPFAVTLERTYGLYGGQELKIAPGVYRCSMTIYYRGNYPTYEIHVPGHTRILFHKANLEEELDGCIAIGEQFGELNGKPAILQSGKGFEEFMQKMRGLAFFDLTIE